ncbi:MAG: serine/threonine protein phosphatase 1 [Ascidiaceihabitans sp.]|jgi:serine/threonine protein phosphatase 1
MSETVYAIGDVHGQLRRMNWVLDLIEKDGGKDAKIVFVGDYTDRGPDSKGVIDQLVEAKEAGRNWTFLLGNHDEMFAMFMQSPPQHDAHLPTELYWLHQRLGGDTTMASYGVESEAKKRLSTTHGEALETIPQSHVDFLNELELSHTHEDLFFCHAGIRPEVPLDEQIKHDLIWIRQEFHDYTAPHPKLIVHGHTPVDQATHYGNRVNIDSGAGYGKELTATVFEDGRVWKLTDQGRVELKAD